jgi:AraC-like DNA-binding protein
MLLDLLCDVVKAYGVRMRRYGENLSNLEEYDDGLRSRLFQRNDTSRLAASLRASAAQVLYITEDAYRCRYCFFHPPETCGENARYCVIGPWLESLPDDAAVDGILRQGNIPWRLKGELAQYLNWVPVIASPEKWEAVMRTFAAYLYGGQDQFQLSSAGLDLGTVDYAPDDYSPEPKETLSMQIIEERYQNENAMLKAISEGDAKRALQCITWFRGYRGQRRASDDIRDRKNYCIVLNSLARKAAENGYVHPAHIDAVSTEFARRIEAVSGAADFSHLSEIMLRRYCALVEAFSLRGYSPVIRNIINTVDFNMQEVLTLDSLSRQFNVNPSYLSKLFKKEKCMTLTDYINTKRMQHAVSLLRGSGAYIQDVAEQCGFLDVNYFSRLFRRYYGRSPREFQKSLK